MRNFLSCVTLAGLTFLILTVMQIKIECFHFDNVKKVTDYRNTILVDSSKSVSFDSLRSSLALLYPKSKYVTFSLSLNDE